MKDMELSDIMNRPVRPFTLLSIYKYGIWQFGTPTNAVRTVDNQTFYLISNRFGLSRQGTKNPRILARRGSPGDYISMDQTGAYAIVPAADYKRMFPPRNMNPPSVPTNSEQLLDSKFLTNILKGSKPTVSNSTTIKPSPPSTGY